MILATKWLEAGKFVWPPIRDGAMQMPRKEFSLLAAGIDLTRVKQSPVKRPLKVGRSYWFCLRIPSFVVGFVTPLRHDPLPKDPTQLTRIILSVNEENADLKARVAFLETQLFGTKSEKMTTIDPTQAILAVMLIPWSGIATSRYSLTRSFNSSASRSREARASL